MEEGFRKEEIERAIEVYKLNDRRDEEEEEEQRRAYLQMLGKQVQSGAAPKATG